jgi:hypothetical protein
MGMLAAGVASGSWIAVGFPVVPGQMVEATAMVLTPCASCPSGTRVLDCFLAGKTTAAVSPPGRLGVSEVSEAAGPGGALQATFKVKFRRSAARREALWQRGR